jgi:hypothetical protein
MNATVLDSTFNGETISELWQTTGFVLDSLVARYRNDAGLKWILPNRTLKLGERVLTNVIHSSINVMEFSLSQNYPNPFNPSTTISYDLPTRSHVTLRIFNVLGQEVTTLVDGIAEAGTHQVRWSPGRLASGVYLYQLKTGAHIETKKMVILR